MDVRNFESKQDVLIASKRTKPTFYSQNPDPTSQILFGLVIGFVDEFVDEFGYFSLEELEGARGPLGLPIERDEHFEPTSLEELRDHYRDKGYAK